MILTEKIRLVNRSDLSKGSKLLATEIIIASNFRGYCWHSVAALGAAISSSESQVHAYIRELVTGGYIRIERRPGRSNRYSLGEVFGKSQAVVRVSVPKIETKYKENVQNVTFNFSENKPSEPKPPAESKPFDMSLVREIESIVGSSRDRGCWITIVRKADANTIYSALSNLKISMNEGIVAKPGGYLVNAIKKYYPDIFDKTYSVSLSTSPERSVVRVKPATEPLKQDWDAGLEAIRRIKAGLR